MKHVKSDAPKQTRSIESMINWVAGTGATPSGQLPSLVEEPIPKILQEIALPHPKQPLGSTAMLHGSGARARLKDMRVGAWTIAPHCNWRYIKAPTGSVEWIPKSIDLPENLFVPYTNAL
jgi:hypothetical protein